MIAQALTKAVPTTMSNPLKSGVDLISTALINKNTGEILAERVGPISHTELFKRYERQGATQ